MEKSKVAIIVKGGVVQEVITNDKNIEFILVDYDNIEQGHDMEEFPAAVFDNLKFDSMITSIKGIINSIKSKIS